MSWLATLGAVVGAVRTVADAVVPFVDLAEGAGQRRHERKQAKHQRELRLIEQGADIRRGPLDEITFVLFFWPWVALWIPYAPLQAHTVATLEKLGDMPEVMVWPALLIVARIWGVAADAVPKRLWKR